MYLATQIIKENPTNKDLRDRIGEQKFVLADMFKILQVYKSQDKNLGKSGKRL